MEDILKAGGNAADAAVAVAAVLQVTEPCSTGLGGDAFCMFYDSKTKRVHGLNGSGQSSSKISLDYVRSKGFNETNPIPTNHGLSVTIPGAAAAWEDTVETWGSGKISMKDILTPAIEMAETGFPVQQVVSHMWANGSHLLTSESNTHGKDLLLNGKAPRHGELMKNPHLASVLKEFASDGKKGFYEGRIGKSIVETINQFGGVMTKEDLSSYKTKAVEPVYADYKGMRLWELPPNGQGMTALIALNILEGLEMADVEHNSSLYLHLLIESLRLGFVECLKYCSDPDYSKIPLDRLLSKDYASKLRDSMELYCPMKPSQIKASIKDTFQGNDTVYFTTADKDGNACSFINSNFIGFGTGLVPEGCGFVLHNRGCGFSLDPSHANVLAPRKRPYHTIIPAMVTNSRTGELAMSYGVMGGFMQPQGHVQVLLNMVEYGCNPQEALDLPRICLGDGYSGLSTLDTVSVEEGVNGAVPDNISDLKAMGYNDIREVCGSNRLLFGKGQIVSRGDWWSKSRAKEEGGGDQSPLYWSGSDPRADGCVAAY